MDFNILIFILKGLLLLISPLCWAQSGYQYGRNDLSAGVPATVASPLRPLTAGFGAASTAAAAFPTAATAFGPGTTIPSGPFGGFGTTGQNQRGIGGLNPTAQTAFGGAATNIPKRPGIAQRPTATGATGTGIYGQSQFGGGATGRGGAGGGAGSATGSSGLGDDYDGDYSAIPGVPGVDYPIYSQVPPTNFDCAQQALPGYYSDIEAQCQVFHICALNRTYSFLCPNGTIFSQEVLVCVWWNQYDCASAPSLYANNAFIYDYGNERIPTNAGYQTSGNQQQLGGRGQTGILAANAGRPTAAGGSNIFNPQRLQPSVTGGGAVQPSAIAAVQTTGGFGGGSGSGRFGGSGQNPGQTFPATPTPFGSVLRSGTTAGGGGGGGGAGASSVAGPTGGGGNFNANVGETAFGNAAIATQTTKNREYLPPPARRQ
ncbi:uncharacterized protein [Musca autumnalis]|uniref:uncharacterized protein n=1 Tax=Musca autumnalis TaxID=221902 RepID=UPI003CEA3275